MRPAGVIGAILAGALLASTLATPALAEADSPNLTVTGVVAKFADGALDGDAFIVAGNTTIPVVPDALAHFEAGDTVSASLTIPADTARDLRISNDLAAETAKGEAVVEALDAPLEAESVSKVRVAAAAIPTTHYVDVAVNINGDGYIQPSNATIRKAISDAGAYWNANTGGSFGGFSVRTIIRYTSKLSCKASDESWWAEAATNVGRDLDAYLEDNSGEHLVLIGECRHDEKAALGSLGTSLADGGLVLTQADIYSYAGAAQFLNGLLAHEFGHNFGLEHANGPALDGCDIQAVPAYTQITRCGTSDYADDYSIMGFAMPIAWVPLLDVARRDQLGVMDSSSLATQRTVTTATYELTALGASGGLKGVRVEVPSGTFYIEFRNGTGEPGAYYLDEVGCVAEWELSPTCTTDINPEGPGVRVLQLAPDGSTRMEPVRTQTQSLTFAEYGLDQGDWWISGADDLQITIDAIVGDTATVTVRLGSVNRVTFNTPTRIVGTPTLGVPVTFDPGIVSVPDSQLTYRWFRNGVEIAGASGPTYTPVAADAGTTLAARVEARDEGFAPAQRAPLGKAVTPGAPSLVGAAKVDVTIGATLGSWPAGFSFAYQWLRGGSAIPGATGEAYTPVAADAGKKLALRVTATHPTLGVVTLTSPAAVVATGNLSAPTPTISGTVFQGRTVTAVKGAWASGTTVTYRWYANGVAISGATKSTYVIPKSLAGKKLSVRVTGSKTGYTTTSATSAQAGIPVVGKITITGTARVGRILTARHSGWLSGTAFTYQWYANGAAIKGATASTYKVTSGQANKYVTVKATARKTGFTTVSYTSPKTAKIAR